MNVLICDDQKYEVERLVALLGTSGFDVRISAFIKGQEVLDYIHTGPLVDVCFLDIIMPEMDGIELAEKLRKVRFSGEIVFLTSSNDYARQSYSVKAFDYLIKPPTPQSVKRLLAALENAHKNADRKGLTIKIQGDVSFILFRDISHAEVIDHNVYIRLCGGTELKVYTTFAELAAELLSDSRFVQCHRSYIVNVSDIKTVSNQDVIMQNGAKIPVSRGYSHVKETMMEWMYGGGKK
jgi:DNA-binding LytR/AlgR family response regulator